MKANQASHRNTAAPSSGTRPRGFTLFELVMTITIISILAGVAAPLLYGGFQLFANSTAVLDTQDKLRYATERMARELRETQNSAGTYTIVLAANNVNFTKDDGTAIAFNGSAPPLLTMTDSGAGGPFLLTDEVTSVVFTGFEIDGTTTTTDATAIAFVDITLTLGNFAQGTRVALRNQP